MDKAKTKYSFLDSFTIRDEESCLKSIRNGAIAAFVSAGITAIFAFVGIFYSSPSASLSYFLDPWLFLDVLLLVILAIFIFKKSRIASTLLVIYFVVSKIMIIAETGKFKGSFLAIIFFLYFFTAMRGTYRWHSSYKNTPEKTNFDFDPDKLA